MSMLAERKHKVKWCLNPRGNDWSADSNKFGQKLLEKMGWNKGKGLGRNQDGITEHVKVSYKNDSKGMGFKESNDQWTEHEDKFSALLKNLGNSSENSDESLESSKPKSLEEKSKSSRSRVHYHKFTRGKDLTRYSSKDLANIFGRKELTKRMQQEKQDIEEEEEEMEQKQLFVTGGSMVDYFKKKLPNSPKKNSFVVGSNGVLKVESEESESEIGQASFGFGFNQVGENEEGKLSSKQKTGSKSTFVSYLHEETTGKRKLEDSEDDSRWKKGDEEESKSEIGLAKSDSRQKTVVKSTFVSYLDEETGGKRKREEDDEETGKKKKKKKKGKKELGDEKIKNLDEEVVAEERNVKEEAKKYKEECEENVGKEKIVKIMEEEKKESKVESEETVVSKSKKKKKKNKKKKKAEDFGNVNPSFEDFNVEGGNVAEEKELKKKKKVEAGMVNPAFEDNLNLEENTKKKQLDIISEENEDENLDISHKNEKNEESNPSSYEESPKKKKKKKSKPTEIIPEKPEADLGKVNPCFEEISSKEENLTVEPVEIVFKMKKKRKRAEDGNVNVGFSEEIEEGQGQVKENPYEVKTRKSKKEVTKTETISGIDNPAFGGKVGEEEVSSTLMLNVCVKQVEAEPTRTTQPQNPAEFNVDTIEKAMEAFQAEIENDLNAAKDDRLKHFVGEGGEPHEGNVKVDGGVRLGFKGVDLSGRVYDAEDFGENVPKTSYKGRIIGDIIVKFCGSNLDEVLGYGHFNKVITEQ